MSQEEEFEVESFIDYKPQKTDKFMKFDILVKWKGYDDPDENTWEPLD
jgi:hypothetical protein